jgi:pyruvate kinase
VKILLDDGKLIFEIVETDKTQVIARVIQGGELKSKGVNLPNTKISLPAMTEKDIADAIFAIEQKVDCTFFCKTPQDLKDLQNLIAEHSDYKIPIIAKIEMKH